MDILFCFNCTFWLVILIKRIWFFSLFCYLLVYSCTFEHCFIAFYPNKYWYALADSWSLMLIWERYKHKAAAFIIGLCFLSNQVQLTCNCNLREWALLRRNTCFCVKTSLNFQFRFRVKDFLLLKLCKQFF